MPGDAAPLTPAASGPRGGVRPAGPPAGATHPASALRPGGAARLTPRRLLSRLHWLLGLTAGLVLALMGLTGALMSYEEAILAGLNADHAAVADGRTALGPEALAAQAAGTGRVDSLAFLGAPVETVRVRFAPGPAGAPRPPSLDLDPYDGRVLGPVRGEAFFATVRRLHRWLLLPDDGRGWGRTVTGVSALALVVLLATGLFLRWPALHRWRIWLRPSLARPGRPRWWSVHAVLGTWCLPVYAVFVLSGLWWSFPWYRTGAEWLLTGGAGRTRVEAGQRPAAGPALDAAYAAFRAGDGRDADLAILTVPARPDRPIRIRYRAAGSGTATARDEAIHDAATGQRLAASRDADRTLGQRMAANMLEVHRGRFFGALFAFVFCVAALMMPVFAATGLTLYVLRRRARRPAPARGRGALAG